MSLGCYGKRFCVLVKIAQDIFSVCASSTPSEAQFSKAGKVANPWRNSFGYKSMHPRYPLFEILVNNARIA